ncbi:MAG: hypothetical protein WA749_10940 [Gelidibacter sp.]
MGKLLKELDPLNSGWDGTLLEDLCPLMIIGFSNLEGWQNS